MIGKKLIAKKFLIGPKAAGRRETMTKPAAKPSQEDLRGEMVVIVGIPAVRPGSRRRRLGNSQALRELDPVA